MQAEEFRRIRVSESSILSKTCLAFLRESDHLWARVLHSKYGDIKEVDFGK